MAEVPNPANLARRGGCWIESEAVPVHLGADRDFRPSQKAHPAFMVDHLAAYRERLAFTGIECCDDEPLDGRVRTCVFDPFGHRIELIQPT